MGTQGVAKQGCPHLNLQASEVVMPEVLKKKAFSEEFLTPMNAQKPSQEKMPDVANFGDVAPPDPLGVVPPSGKGGSIGSMRGKGGK